MRDGHRLNMYADTYDAMLRLPREQLTENIRAFLRYWGPEEVNCTTAGNSTELIQVLSTGQKYVECEFCMVC